VRLSPLGTAATNWPVVYQPQMVGEGDYGAIGGMKIGRGNRSTRKNPALVSFCPPQIPHYFILDRTLVAANNRLSYGTTTMQRLTNQLRIEGLKLSQRLLSLGTQSPVVR
jgi:hypothetical protein